ncbi:5-formyltetrahydrofolate cyclo-ligase [Halalkalibacter krulwichiae]|uniref:5-formyltetrahydrofolate cyclo-ligase n=1 Tax=Halalkalibacter krulwichiae TaxID=199441 RepID=A0A1X9MB47_9BACI|nr:5-formyltetrahydrofolate cyclo-ligase [Halalkalibacter krulwichiae]ARK29383.1 putative 5-formyltetrahydrofolate cyclo-ligase [Halalkalibacter krulwichiae]
MNEKGKIRKQILDNLNNLTSEQLFNNSKNIQHHLVHSSYWKEASIIGLTISRDKEVHTYEIIEEGWRQNKKIAVPRANFKTKEMTFFEITSFEQLEESTFGLKEPLPYLCPVMKPESIDLMIVPGVAFDKEGYRLGYGGGFYDRYLPKVQASMIALAYECQLIERVPLEQHDKKVDRIISEKGFYR